MAVRCCRVRTQRVTCADDLPSVQGRHHACCRIPKLYVNISGTKRCAGHEHAVLRLCTISGSFPSSDQSVAAACGSDNTETGRWVGSGCSSTLFPGTLASLVACEEMCASGGYALCAFKDNQRCRGFNPDSDGACSVSSNRAWKRRWESFEICSGAPPLPWGFRALLHKTEHAPSESGWKPRHRWLSFKAHSA